MVVPQNDRIFAATVVSETEETCGVNIELQKEKINEAIVSFYCLEPKQGTTLNVYHTNTIEKDTEVFGENKRRKDN